MKKDADDKKDMDDFIAFQTENGGDILKKIKPDASPFECKIAEIVKVTILQDRKMFTSCLKKSIEGTFFYENCVEITLDPSVINKPGCTKNGIFELMHLCNEMHINYYLYGKSFGYLCFRFRPMNKKEIGGIFCETKTKSYISGIGRKVDYFGGCKIEDMSKE
jgi:hypothetical protein